MLKSWKIIAVVVAVIGVVVIGAITLPKTTAKPTGTPAPAPIDFEAELKGLTLDGQGTDPDARNGWDALIAIGADAERIRKSIERREADADETMKLTGREAEIEPWTVNITGGWSCNPRTPRDERLIAEFWEAMASERIFERIGELRGFDVYVMDFTDRSAAQLRLGLAGGTPPETHSRVRSLCAVVISASDRAIDRGDWDAALGHLDDLVFLSRGLSAQANLIHWLNGRGCVQAAHRVVQRTVLTHPGPPREFLVDAKGVLDMAPAASLSRLVEFQRLEALESIDVALEVLDQGGAAAHVLTTMSGWDSAKAARKVIEDSATRIAGLATAESGIVEAELPKIRAELESVKGILSMGVSSMDAALRGPAWVRDSERDRDVTSILIALALHANDHGAPPDTLDALVPAYLPVLPVDPFAPDRRFRYIPGPTMRDIVVYTVGWDSKDDGGTYIPERAGRALTPDGSDGLDYVFTRDPCEGREN